MREYFRMALRDHVLRRKLQICAVLGQCANIYGIWGTLVTMVLVDDVITYNLSLGGATAGGAMMGGEDAYGCGEGGCSCCSV